MSTPSDPLGALAAQIGRALFAPIMPILEELMSSYADLRTRIDTVRADAETAKVTVLDAVRALRLQLEHLTGLITTGDVPADVLEALDQIDATIRAIDPNDPSTLPQPEPAPEPPAVQLTPDVASHDVTDA